MYKLLCGHKFSFFLDRNLGLELLGHKVTLFLAFRGTAKLFSKVAASYYLLSHKQCMRVPISPHPHQNLLMSAFFLL